MRGVIMYPEFIAIFVGIGILALIMILILILQLVILKQMKTSRSIPMEYSNPNVKSSNINTPVAGKVGIVYCKNCMNPYPADKNVCPHCQTPR